MAYHGNDVVIRQEPQALQKLCCTSHKEDPLSDIAPADVWLFSFQIRRILQDRHRHPRGKAARSRNACGGCVQRQPFHGPYVRHFYSEMPRGYRGEPHRRATGRIGVKRLADHRLSTTGPDDCTERIRIILPYEFLKMHLVELSQAFCSALPTICRAPSYPKIEIGVVRQAQVARLKRLRESPRPLYYCVWPSEFMHGCIAEGRARLRMGVMTARAVRLSSCKILRPNEQVSGKPGLGYDDSMQVVMVLCSNMMRMRVKSSGKWELRSQRVRSGADTAHGSAYSPAPTLFP